MWPKRSRIDPGAPMSDQRFILEPGQPGYPPQLIATPEPPKRLYGIGDPGLISPGLAIVGARKATPYGLRATRLFASGSAGAGLAVISGAAIGCDGEAHRAAIDAGGVTIAVLGCGADVDYPRRSADMLAHMRSHAVVLSELPFGTPPARWAFVRRNRIIAGLARALLVVEAGLPSGTFSTADAALDAGRDVFVVPGSIFSPESRGSNRLMRQGAVPVTDVSELADALGMTGIHHRTAATQIECDSVTRALAADPQRPDDLARALGIDIVSAARTLGRLESSGAIVRYADGRYGVG